MGRNAVRWVSLIKLSLKRKFFRQKFVVVYKRLQTVKNGYYTKSSALIRWVSSGFLSLILLMSCFFVAFCRMILFFEQ